ncbi:MAG TPA: hypothetical protein VK537_08405 [Galbitalea sp.]|nr:hypothetical protein [Galbitalea sp.]
MPDDDEDRAAGIAEIARYLDSLPQPGPGKGRRFAVHSVHARVIAAEWWDKGLRLHQDKAVIFPIPSQQRGVRPGSKLLDWVDAEEYGKYMAEHPGAAHALAEVPEKAASLERLQAALREINPELAAKLPTMTDAERAAARAEFAARVPAAVRRLADLADRNDRIRQNLQDGVAES